MVLYHKQDKKPEPENHLLPENCKSPNHCTAYTPIVKISEHRAMGQRYSLIGFFHSLLFAASDKKDEVKQQNENDIQRDGFFHKGG